MSIFLKTINLAPHSSNCIITVHPPYMSWRNHHQHIYVSLKFLSIQLIFNEIINFINSKMLILVWYTLCW